METLAFSYNWNNKLNCNCFSTVRIWQPGKFEVGRTFTIVEKGKVHGEARIEYAKQIPFGKITEAMALLDTGYNLEEFKSVVKRMYTKYINKHGSDALFGFYVFRYSTKQNGLV